MNESNRDTPRLESPHKYKITGTTMNPRAQGPEQPCQAHAAAFISSTVNTATVGRVRCAAVKYAGSDAGSGADDDAERLVARRFELYAFTLDERSGP